MLKWLQWEIQQKDRKHKKELVRNKEHKTSRLDEAEDWISDLEDKAAQNTQSEQ